MCHVSYCRGNYYIASKTERAFGETKGGAIGGEGGLHTVPWTVQGDKCLAAMVSPGGPSINPPWMVWESNFGGGPLIV